MEQGPIAENSPTLTAHASISGVIVGTPAYMSPEQARGTRVDHRTDIWAFGVVLVEMLTGRRLFDGPTVSDIMVAVLSKDPPLDAVPAQLRPLVSRCLDRDVRKRLGWIGEVSPLLDARPARNFALPRWVIPAIVLGPLITGVAMWLLRSPKPAAELPMRAFSFTPNSLATTDFAHRAVISPNGQYIAYVAENRLWIRDLALERARPLEGCENAEGPFWSPDSAHIAFVAATELKKVPAAPGGVPSILAKLKPGYRGGAWNPDGRTLIISLATKGIFEVPAAGGALKPMTQVLATASGSTPYFPQFLPDGHTLITGKGSRWRQVLELIDLKTGRAETLRNDGTSPALSPAGYLLFQTSVRHGGLWALPFSPVDRKATGEPIPLLKDGSDFSVSEEGTLAWVDMLGGGSRRLTWVDRSGNRTAIAGSPQNGIADIEISPDGTKAAYTAEEQGNPDVWNLDLVRSVRSRVTFAPDFDAIPRWTPSGKEIAFSSVGQLVTRAETYVQPADASGVAKLVFPGLQPHYPQAWSSDGRTLIYVGFVAERGYDLWTTQRKADGSFEKPSVWLQSSFDEYNASLSPDGRFLLYTSNEQGHAEVYLQAYPGGGDKRQVSSGGGSFGRWGRNGREIFYVQGGALFAVPIGAGAASIGAPQELFRLSVLEAPMLRYPYDVSPDGQRFLVAYPEDPEAAKPAAIHVVQNWPALLRKQ
jgi:Tol biopolymer transport system component